MRRSGAAYCRDLSKHMSEVEHHPNASWSPPNLSTCSLPGLPRRLKNPSMRVLAPSDHAGTCPAPFRENDSHQPRRHHPAKLKRGRKAKTMAHMEIGDGASSSKASDPATGIAKHGRHGRGGDWTTITKAAKEPAYKGPWVSSKAAVAGVVKRKLCRTLVSPRLGGRRLTRRTRR